MKVNWDGVPEAVRASMRANKARDTKPELRVRSLLWRLGYRFRLHRRDLPGCPDIVFTARRKAVFIHGCFWHQHEGCRRSRQPGTRRDYWGPKLARNKARDATALEALAEKGWSSLIIWECETGDAGKLAATLEAFLGPVRVTHSGGDIRGGTTCDGSRPG